MKPKRIIIAGGGIAGLTAATTLARCGFSVDVFEQATEFSHIGAGIQISANAMHVLDALGAKPKLISKAVEPGAVYLRDYKSGNVLLKVPMKASHADDYGQPYLNIHRADLHAILLGLATQAGVTLHMGCRVKDLSFDGDSASLKVFTENGSSQGATHTADFVIGADGIHSALRHKLVPAELAPETTPEFTSQVAWRATLPRAALSDRDTRLDWDTPCVHNWLAPGRHLVAYAVNAGADINIVAVQEQAEWQAQSWSFPGDTFKLRAVFEDFEPDVQALLARVERCYVWGLFDHPPPHTWSYKRLALIGDAVHPMLPFMAQGAAMAIEDAWVLTHVIQNSRHQNNIDLSPFTQARYKRVARIYDTARKNARLYHLKSLPARAARAVAFKMAGVNPNLAASRLSDIYGVNVVRDYPIRFDED